MVKAD
jgi:hypothetical protein